MADFSKGDKVVVRRGRKVPIGTQGIIFWIGEGEYGTRLGLKNDPTNYDEEPTWVPAKNCDLLEPGEDAQDSLEDSDEAPAPRVDEQVPELIRLRRDAEESNAEIEILKAQIQKLNAELTLLKGKNASAPARLSDETCRQIAEAVMAGALAKSAPAPIQAAPVAPIERKPEAQQIVKPNVSAKIDEAIAAIDAQEAPRKGLAKCPKCQKFVLGSHKCVS